MAEPSHDSRDPRPRREEARRDTRSTSPASANTSREASSPERLHQRRTTAANTTASALRPHPPNPERRRDARERYKGYSFVFATDCYHNEDKIFGRGIVNSVSYIKPLINQHQHDSLPPVKLPYFFTGFTWTDENNESRAMSRLDICHAWQVAFNQLIYYGSITGVKGSILTVEENTWVKEQFSLWDDLFTELDEALGRLTACERQRHVPRFLPAEPTSQLANPYNRTSIETGLDSITSTFLAAATECNVRTDKMLRSPLPNALSLEEKLRPWEPCRGHPIVNTTAWTLARINATGNAQAAGQGFGSGHPHRSGLER